MTLLTFDQLNYEPCWNYSGSKFLYQKWDGGAERSYLIADDNGGVLDSIEYYNFFPDWGGADDVIICGGQGVNYILPGGYIHQQLIPSAVEGESVLTVHWGAGYDIFFTENGDIYKTNFITKEVERIKEKCPGKYYSYISVSGDGSKILATVSRRILENGNTIKKFNEIRLMNADGSDEKIIEIPF